MTTQTTALAMLAVVLVLFGIVAFLFGEFLFAGLCFLLVSMTIYVRETRS